MTVKRLKPEVRKEEIIACALELAQATDYARLTRDQIAKAAGVSGPAILYHFSTMQQLRNAVMRTAVKRENLLVIASGLLAKDPHALRADPELARRAMSALCGTVPGVSDDR